jgi:hypothetical protein
MDMRHDSVEITLRPFKNSDSKRLIHGLPHWKLTGNSDRDSPKGDPQTVRLTILLSLLGRSSSAQHLLRIGRPFEKV